MCEVFSVTVVIFSEKLIIFSLLLSVSSACPCTPPATSSMALAISCMEVLMTPVLSETFSASPVTLLPNCFISRINPRILSIMALRLPVSSLNSSCLFVVKSWVKSPCATLARPPLISLTVLLMPVEITKPVTSAAPAARITMKIVMYLILPTCPSTLLCGIRVQIMALVLPTGV